MARNDATRKLIAHVAVRVGGVAQLAEKLSISRRLLRTYITGERLIPDSLFLRVVDLVLDQPERQAQTPAPSQAAAQGYEEDLKRDP